MASIRILIADDHRLFRQSLSELCVTKGGFDVVGEAEDGQAAIELARRLQPHVILMDIRMPKMDGVQATEFITKEYPTIRIIVLTMHQEDRYILDAIHAGAYGYLLKNVDAQELFVAIRTVHHGDALLAPAMTLKVLNDIRRRKQLGTAGQDSLESLTEGEKDVARLVAQGLENREISAQLHIAVSTVANRLREIYQKLSDVNNRTQLALWARRNGLAAPDEQ